jgi:hypothetical protein
MKNKTPSILGPARKQTKKSRILWEERRKEIEERRKNQLEEARFTRNFHTEAEKAFDNKFFRALNCNIVTRNSDQYSSPIFTICDGMYMRRRIEIQSQFSAYADFTKWANKAAEIVGINVVRELTSSSDLSLRLPEKNGELNFDYYEMYNGFHHNHPHTTAFVEEEKVSALQSFFPDALIETLPYPRRKNYSGMEVPKYIETDNGDELNPAFLNAGFTEIPLICPLQKLEVAFKIGECFNEVKNLIIEYVLDIGRECKSVHLRR